MPTPMQDPSHHSKEPATELNSDVTGRVTEASANPVKRARKREHEFPGNIETWGGQGLKDT